MYGYNYVGKVKMAGKSDKSVSEALRRAIRAYPASLNEKARLSGVDVGLLCRFLQGRSMTTANVDKVASWLGLELRPAGQDKPKAKATKTKAATKRQGKVTR